MGMTCMKWADTQPPPPSPISTNAIPLSSCRGEPVANNWLHEDLQVHNRTLNAADALVMENGLDKALRIAH